MMLLAIDIGNSNIALAYQNQRGWSAIMRQNTKNEHNEIYALSVYYDFFAEGIKKYCVEGIKKHCAEGIKKYCAEGIPEHIDTIIISSVVPTLTPIIQEIIHSIFCTKTHSIKTIVVDLTMQSPLVSPIPAELGADLFANAVASYSKSNFIMNKSVIGTNQTTPTASLTVDMGTALSFTAVDGYGSIVGVAITAGIETAFHALIKNTGIGEEGTLHTYNLEIPTQALGKTTHTALGSGIMLGYKHLIKGMVNQIKDEVGAMKVYATGGLSEFMKSLPESLAAPNDTVFDEINPYHTLDGLSILATYNQ